MMNGELDQVLRYYYEELSYLREMGQIFAARYPKVAQRLELGPTEIGDPHVERLIEAFAFLTGRIRRILHDDFPEIAGELLSVLRPHYLCPIPAMTVAVLEADPQQATSGEPIPRGTPLFATAAGGETCWFRTCYPVEVWPLRVTDAGFVPLSRWSFPGGAQRAAAVLSVTVEAGKAPLPELAIEDRPLDRLAFFLHGDPTLVYALHELLLAQTEAIWVVPDRGTPRELPPKALRPLGFDADHAVLPDPPTDHPAFRLLQEYFVFPEKFHFVELAGLAGLGERRLELLFFLKRAPESHLAVSARTFCLGTTPVINLFPKTSEPIHLDQTRTEYRLIPDARREAATEVHSVLEVTGNDGVDRRTKVYAPFYSYSHGLAERGHRTFWHARRVLSQRAGAVGTDVLLSFLDLDWKPTLPAEDTVYARTLCTNRDLPRHLPEGARLSSDGAGSAFAISCLKRPSLPRSPALGGQVLWRLLSHLSVAHLGFAGEETALSSLQETLRLYAEAYAPSQQQQIEGLTGLSARKVPRLLPGDPWGGFVRGTEVTLTFDERRFAGSSAFLLAAVLERFLALQASLNSFTELVVLSEQREGEWKRWPPALGDRPLL
jgi:type VI secretion system protein ImpG